MFHSNKEKQVKESYFASPGKAREGLPGVPGKYSNFLISFLTK